MGDPVAVSSVHGLGIGDLLDAVYAYLPPLEEENEEDEKSEEVIKQCDDVFFANEEEINSKLEVYANKIQL